MARFIITHVYEIEADHPEIACMLAEAQRYPDAVIVDRKDEHD